MSATAFAEPQSAVSIGLIPSQLRQIFDKQQRDALAWEPYGSDGRAGRTQTS